MEVIDGGKVGFRIRVLLPASFADAEFTSSGTFGSFYTLLVTADFWGDQKIVLSVFILQRR